MITSTWHSLCTPACLVAKIRKEGGGSGEDFHSFDVQFPVRNDNRARFTSKFSEIYYWEFPFLSLPEFPGFSVKWLIFQKSSNCRLSGNSSRKFTYPFRNFWDFWFNGKHPLLKCATIPPYLEKTKEKN